MPLSLRELSAILEEIPEGVKFPLEELPAETRWDVFLELPFPDLLKNCQVNRETAAICRNETFWRRYNKKHFDITPENYLYHDVRLVTDTAGAFLTGWGNLTKCYTSKEMARVCYDIIHYYLSRGAFPMVDSLKVYLSKEHVINSFHYLYMTLSDVGPHPPDNPSVEWILKNHLKSIGKPESLTLFATELALQVKFLSFDWSDLFDGEDISGLNNSDNPLLLTDIPAGASFFKFVRKLILQTTRYFVPNGIIELPFNVEMAFWISYVDQSDIYCPFADHIFLPLAISFSIYARKLYNSFAPRLYGMTAVELRGGESKGLYLNDLAKNIETDPAIDRLFDQYELIRLTG